MNLGLNCFWFDVVFFWVWKENIDYVEEDFWGDEVVCCVVGFWLFGWVFEFDGCVWDGVVVVWVWVWIFVLVGVVGVGWYWWMVGGDFVWVGVDVLVGVGELGVVWSKCDFVGCSGFFCWGIWFLMLLIVGFIDE